MLYEVVHRFPEDLPLNEEGPLVSLYLPIHKTYPEKKQDPVVFDHLLRDVENALRQVSPDVPLAPFLKPFTALKEDTDFWNLDCEGIAVLAGKNRCIAYHLHSPVRESVTVAGYYQIRPLIKAFQSAVNYHLLGLCRENFSLYRNGSNGLEEIQIRPDIPRTMEDVLGDQFTDPFSSHRSFSGGGGNTFNRGHGDLKQELDKDVEKYFRYVDSFIYENYSKGSKTPLILVSIPSFTSDFRNISKNPNLLAAGINQSVESLDKNELRKKAGKLILSMHQEKMKKLSDAFAEAEGRFLGSSDFVQVTKAAFEGRVEKILVEEDRVVPGIIDEQNGTVDLAGKNISGTEDVIDHLVPLVLAGGGKVYVLSEEEMPSNTGIAAFYRYEG